MLRRALREQLNRIEQGLDPVNVLRDPSANRRIPTGAWNTILRRRKLQHCPTAKTSDAGRATPSRNSATRPIPLAVTRIGCGCIARPAGLPVGQVGRAGWRFGGERYRQFVRCEDEPLKAGRAGRGRRGDRHRQGRQAQSQARAVSAIWGPRKPADALGLTFIAGDFDAPMPDMEAAFEGEEGGRLRILLDTHVFIWWDDENPALAGELRETISEPANEIYVSAASIREIAIKRGRGKIGFARGVKEAIATNRFLALPITPDHAEYAGGLPPHHRDPFDRVSNRPSDAREHRRSPHKMKWRARMAS